MTLFRPQGNSVSERLHPNLDAMLANAQFSQTRELSDSATLQMAYNTPFNTTGQEIPYYSMFMRQPKLLIDTTVGIPDGYMKQTKNNLQLAFERARRSLERRANKQKARNCKLKYDPALQPGR